jgi:integrase
VSRAGYVSEALLPSGRDPVTLGKLVRSLSSYWTWMQRRGLLPEDGRNPWSGQAPQKVARDVTGIEAERAFTDGEVAKLLTSPPSTTLGDFIQVGALTGMRREEIGRLKVADCVGGIFVVQMGKTDAAIRRVPIHSDLAALVERRSAAKPFDAYLFDDRQGLHSIPPRARHTGGSWPALSRELPLTSSVVHHESDQRTPADAPRFVGSWPLRPTGDGALLAGSG